jgi:protein TonB
MFETSVVKEQAVAAPRRVGLMTMSVGFHSLLIIGAVAVSVAATEFPQNAPDQFELYRIAAQVGIPPALGVPDGGGRNPETQPAQKPVTPTQQTAPAAVPDAAPNAEASSTTTDVEAAAGDGPGNSDLPFGRPDGVENGIGIGTQGSGVGTPAAPEPEPVKVYRVGGDVAMPRVLRRVDPIYPQAFVRAGLSATVTVRFVIGKDGRVRDANVIRSSYAPFTQSVIDAATQWTFTPATLHGQPVDAQFELTVRFTAAR